MKVRAALASAAFTVAVSLSMASSCSGPATSTTSSPAQGDSSPPGSTSAALEPAFLPAMVNLGNGGPLSGDASAVDRMNAQFVSIPEDHVVSGSEAIAWAQKLLPLFPELSGTWGTVVKGVACAVKYGVVEVKAYATPRYDQAGLTLVLSRSQLQVLPKIALKCVVASVTGGGPGGSGTARFSPCFDSYSIQDSVKGVPDTYFIYNAGTNSAWCSLIRSSHAPFHPQPIAY